MDTDRAIEMAREAVAAAGAVSRSRDPRRGAWSARYEPARALDRGSDRRHPRVRSATGRGWRSPRSPTSPTRRDAASSPGTSPRRRSSSPRLAGDSPTGPVYRRSRPDTASPPTDAWSRGATRARSGPPIVADARREHGDPMRELQTCDLPERDRTVSRLDPSGSGRGPGSAASPRAVGATRP